MLSLADLIDLPNLPLASSGSTLHQKRTSGHAEVTAQIAGIQERGILKAHAYFGI
jgi:hypothetical protein